MAGEPPGVHSLATCLVIIHVNIALTMAHTRADKLPLNTAVSPAANKVRILRGNRKKKNSNYLSCTGFILGIVRTQTMAPKLD